MDVRRLIALLHRKWTENDGKPWEAWAPGRDLKEMLMIGALVICLVLMAVAIFVQPTP